MRNAFWSVLRRLSDAAPAEPGRMKSSIFGPYFRWTSVDGMVNPFGLEALANPDLLPFEVPFVAAHEWAHLAGYADESEASFLAWLTCLRGDPLAEYSGWLSAFSQARLALPPRVRATLPRLDPGPQQDLQEIAAVYRKSSPSVSQAARRTYDSYLKANRVSEGIESYDAVLKLMLGTTLGSSWR